MPLFVAIFIHSLVDANLPVRNCYKKGDSAAKVTRLEISNCQFYACTFKVNTTAAIKMNLQFKKNVSDLKFNVFTCVPQLNELKCIPITQNLFNEKDEDHCIKTIKASKNCTFFKGKNYEYEFSSKVLDMYYRRQRLGYIKYEISDKNKKIVSCIQFPFRLY
jgi:hypothetical protein